MKNPVITLTFALGTTLCAEPAASPNYAVPANSIDGGGQSASSTNYNSCGSLGGIGGISSVADPAETLKSGYIGQLYEVTTLQISATPTNVQEGATTQLSASKLLDDGTMLAVTNSSITWSVASGPLESIDVSGLAAAAIVYEDTDAQAQGASQGLIGLANLTVLNVNLDDYGNYAGDSMDDEWQVLHFGTDNADAGPLLDPDHDLQNNLFEFTAGLDPTDNTSRFHLAIQSAGPDQMDIVFSPRFVDRTYTVSYTADLTGGAWNPLPSSITNDNGTERSVTDLLAIDPKRFYHVEITKP